MSLAGWVRLQGALWSAMLLVVAVYPANLLRVVVYGGLAVGVAVGAWVYAAKLET